MKVYVVSFAPNGDDGVGGFNWYRYYEAARDEMIVLLQAPNSERYDYRLTTVELPGDAEVWQSDTNLITRHIDALYLL